MSIALGNINGFLDSIKWKLNELYEYRNFIRAQVNRNLYGRYRNSYLGFAWNFLTPLLYLVLSYIMFTEIHKNSIENYVVFLSSGIFMFSLLTTGITGGGSTFTGNSGMIKKMYFPREILVISSAISSAIVMIIGYALVLFLTILTGSNHNIIALLFVPLIWVFAIIFFMGCGFLLGSITVYVRDVQYLLSSMSIVFFICTPIRTMMSDATGLISTIYACNPLTYYVEPMHQIFYNAATPDIPILLISAIIAITTFLIGYRVFLKLRRGFVERL